MAWRRSGNKPLSELMIIQLHDAYMHSWASVRQVDKIYSKPACAIVIWHLRGWTVFLPAGIVQLFNTLRLSGWHKKMAAIFHTTYSNAFSWMKMYQFWYRFHRSLLLTVRLTISVAVNYRHSSYKSIWKFRSMINMDLAIYRVSNLSWAIMSFKQPSAVATWTLKYLGFQTKTKELWLVAVSAHAN